jgi:pimeloyl-ACP methyl ester carboxylesterase
VQKKKLVFVFFGGTWSGGQTPAYRFWFSSVDRWIQNTLIPTFNNREGENVMAECFFITRTAKDTSQEACVANALEQMRHISDGEAVAVCYSAGAEVARRVAVHRPQLFCTGLLVSGMEAGGFRWPTFLRAFWYGWFPFLMGFVTGVVDVARTRCVPAFFTNTTPTKPLEGQVRRNLYAEPMRTVLACTPLRWMVGVSASRPLPFPIVALLGNEDFFLAGATYSGEKAVIIQIPGATHALPLQEQPLTEALERITVRFADMLR